MKALFTDSANKISKITKRSSSSAVVEWTKLTWAKKYKVEISTSKAFKNKKVYDLLLGFLPNKMIDYILKTLDISKDVYYEDLSNDKKQELTKILKEMEFNITSYKEFDFSQACSGGVSLREINPLTMESIFVKNLYIIGELLDVNGDCGGYNLTFAFLSGILTSRGDSNA